MFNEQEIVISLMLVVVEEERQEAEAIYYTATFFPTVFPPTVI